VKLYAKVIPKYFERIKSGEKGFDLRQLETITFYNSETGEEIELEIVGMNRCTSNSEVFANYPDVKWDPNKEVYEIILGKRL